MILIEPSSAVRFTVSSSSATLLHDVSFRQLLPSPKNSSSSYWRKLGRNNALKSNTTSWRMRRRRRKIQSSSGKQLGPSPSGSSPPSNNRNQLWHPFEDLASSASLDSSGHDDHEPTLTPPETARTVVQVNTHGTLMLTSLILEDFHENVFLPDLPYLTDQHGNVYFQVPNDEDILQTLTSENNFVQAIIGFDTTEMVSEMEELLGPSEIDLGIEEIEDEDGDEDNDDDDEDDDDEDYDEDVVAILEDEEEDSDEALGDWAKLETMRSSHPMYFAQKLAQAATDDPVDWMEQPPVGLAIQGIIRPAFIEEHSNIQKHMSAQKLQHADKNQVRKGIEGNLEDLGGINDHGSESETSKDVSMGEQKLEKNEISRNGVSLYKLEMLKIQLISALGHNAVVEVEDFAKAQPDSVALSGAKIISHLKAGGEKTIQALKSLCWGCKGVQVEEAALISIDSLGFDLRVCCGTQIQTLRFAFNSRATSEHNAEKQLHDLLFARANHRLPKKKQNHKK